MVAAPAGDTASPSICNAAAGICCACSATDCSIKSRANSKPTDIPSASISRNFVPHSGQAASPYNNPLSSPATSRNRCCTAGSTDRFVNAILGLLKQELLITLLLPSTTNADILAR